MKKDMPLEGLRWSRDSGSALYDTPPNGRSRTGWGGRYLYSQPFRGQILIFCPIVWFIPIKFISLVVDHPSALWLLIW